MQQILQQQVLSPQQLQVLLQQQQALMSTGNGPSSFPSIPCLQGPTLHSYLPSPEQLLCPLKQ